MTMTLPVLASPAMEKLIAEQQKAANTMRLPTPKERTARPAASRPKELEKLRITSWELAKGQSMTERMKKNRTKLSKRRNVG